MRWPRPTGFDDIDDLEVEMRMQIILDFRAKREMPGGLRTIQGCSCVEGRTRFRCYLTRAFRKTPTTNAVLSIAPVVDTIQMTYLAYGVQRVPSGQRLWVHSIGFTVIG